MTQPNDVHPLQHAAELRLLAEVLELQELTSQAASIRPMTRGEQVQRFIVIGTVAEVARLLEIAPASSVRSIGTDGQRYVQPGAAGQQAAGAARLSGDGPAAPAVG